MMMIIIIKRRSPASIVNANETAHQTN